MQMLRRMVRDYFQQQFIFHRRFHLLQFLLAFNALLQFSVLLLSHLLEFLRREEKEGDVLLLKRTSSTLICCSSRSICVDFSCSMVKRFDRRLISDGCVRICLTGSNFSTEDIDLPREKSRERQTLFLRINEEDMRLGWTIFRID